MSSPAPPPKIPDNPPMPPYPTDPAILEARRRARAQARSRSGYRSTILTTPRGVTSPGQTGRPRLTGTTNLGSE